MNIWFMNIPTLMTLIIDEEWRSCQCSIIITYWFYYRLTVTYANNLITDTAYKRHWIACDSISPQFCHPFIYFIACFLLYTIICYIEIISQNWSTFLPPPLLSFPSHRCTRSSLITLSRPNSLTSRLKIANRSFYHSALVLWNNIQSDLRHVAHHVTPSPILNSLVSELSTSHFLEKLKSISLYIYPFLRNLYSLIISQDCYLRYWSSFVVSSHTHFAIIHRHFIHANFYFIWLVSRPICE